MLITFIGGFFVMIHGYFGWATIVPILLHNFFVLLVVVEYQEIERDRSWRNFPISLRARSKGNKERKAKSVM